MRPLNKMCFISKPWAVNSLFNNKTLIRDGAEESEHLEVLPSTGRAWVKMAHWRARVMLPLGLESKLHQIDS